MAVVNPVDNLGGALRWRNIGPSRGGRVVAVAGDPGSPGVFYMGACGGGVWKTTDGGAYWRNVSDGFFQTAAVGALAVSPSDPNVVYAGMGEACVRNDVSYGDGVYRSTDAGRTWVHCGLEATRHIARVRIHPRDPSIVYVAALGDIFGPNPDRGVYRSTDGGGTWKQVLFRDERSGAADLWLDPANPSVLYAAIWEAIRRPWEMVSGGPGSSLFRSTDGGETWVALTAAPGLPAGPLGRIGVAGAPRRSGRVWALVEAAGETGGVYRSEDGGDTWARASENRGVQGRPWYYSHLVPDPLDPDTLWSLNFGLWRSIDGGTTFEQVTTPHGDNHDLWIDPSDPRRMIEGNDGGACVTFNGGETFSTIYNQPTSAFYHLAVDSHFPYRVSATQQDNSAIRVPSRTREAAIPWEQCTPVGTSESGYIAVDPLDDEVIYSGAVGSAGGGGAPLIRHDHRLRQDRLVTVWPELGTGDDPANFKHRFNWTYPLLFSPQDPRALYAGGERVFRSTDAGQTWEAISPDLTRADPEKLKASGGPITKDTSGAEVYATLSCLAFTPAGDTLWAGTDDGRVHLTNDGGATWNDVTPAELPDWAWVTCIEPDPHHAGTAYLTATRYRLQDRNPYLLVTRDSGQTWALATAGIEPDDYLRIVRADPARPGVLYAGSERRAYFSFDGAETWHSLRLNMPAVPIYDLAVVGDELVAASHGRGFWILDGLHVLGDLSDLAGSPTLLVPDLIYRFPTPAPRGAAAAGAAIGLQYLGTAVAYSPPGAVPPDQKNGGRSSSTILNGGENPADGITIRYYLPQPPDDGSLRVTILDAAGGEVVSLPPAALGAAAGFNRAGWDLRAAGVAPLPLSGTDPEEAAREARGPLVPPGRYTIRLEGPGISLTREFEVRADPREKVTAGDFARQYEIGRRIMAERKGVRDAVLRLRTLREQVSRWQRGAGPESSSADGVGELTGSILGQLDGLERRLTQPDMKDDADRLKFPAGLDMKLGALSDLGDAVDAAPTAATEAVLDELSGQARSAVEALSELTEGPVAELDRRIRASDRPIVGG